MTALKVVLGLLLFISCSELIEFDTGKKIILDIITKTNYDKTKVPMYQGSPLIVNISLHINDISSVSEINMEFTVDMILRHHWNDYRLAYNVTNASRSMIQGVDMIDHIWTPDTFFKDSKSFTVQTSTNNVRNAFCRIQPSGNVYYSLRTTVVNVCRMNLKYFPMDKQLCELILESYSYGLDELVYLPNDTDSNYGLSHEFSLSNFKVEGYKFHRIVIENTIGKYPQLVFGILFTRSMGYYLNQVYMPAIMIVVISWIPFWLDRDDSHARVGLGVTTVLTMTTLVTNTNSALPKISYLKSIDVYLGFCFANVFAALIEYAIVGYFKYKIDNRISVINVNEGENLKWKGSNSQSRIDWFSRWIFPLIFSVFNLIYWSVYLKLTNKSIDEITLISNSK